MITKLMKILIDVTKKDKIIWRNTMLNIHETVFHGKKIWTDWERDESPMISIDQNVLEARFAGIRDLRTAIDEQYKRLKKYRYSDESLFSSKAIESKRQEEKSNNYKDFLSKAFELWELENKSKRQDRRKK